MRRVAAKSTVTPAAGELVEDLCGHEGPVVAGSLVGHAGPQGSPKPGTAACFS